MPLANTGVPEVDVSPSSPEQGDVVIAERYVVDTAVYNRYFIGKEFSTYEKILLRLVPKNTLLIHLDADKNELTQRRQRDWPEDFIDYQLEQYKIFASEMGALTINTSNKKIEEVSEIITSACRLHTPQS